MFTEGFVLNSPFFFMIEQKGLLLYPSCFSSSMAPINPFLETSVMKPYTILIVPINLFIKSGNEIVATNAKCQGIWSINPPLWGLPHHETQWGPSHLVCQIFHQLEALQSFTHFPLKVTMENLGPPSTPACSQILQ